MTIRVSSANRGHRLRTSRVRLLEAHQVDCDSRIRDCVIALLEGTCNLLVGKVLNLKPCVPGNVKDEVPSPSNAPSWDTEAYVLKEMHCTFLRVPKIIARYLVELGLLRRREDHCTTWQQ